MSKRTAYILRSNKNTDTCNSLSSSPSSPYFLLLPLIFTQGLTVESDLKPLLLLPQLTKGNQPRGLPGFNSM